MMTSKQFGSAQVPLRHQRQFIPRYTVAGFTLIESLLAIIVVGILMSAISPVIVLSVANRVQTRRIELGTQAARTYVDGVRAGTIAAPDEISPKPSSPPAPPSAAFKDFPAPGTTLNCATVTDGYCNPGAVVVDGVSTNPKRLYCIDRDGGGCTNTSSQDMVIQVFRYHPTSTDPKKGYLMGLRVYRADAFKDDGALKTMGANQAKQSSFTGGLGDRKTPLVEMATEVIPGNATFRDLCDRLGGC